MAVVPHARSGHALPGWFPLSRVRFQGGIAISEKRWEGVRCRCARAFLLSLRLSRVSVPSLHFSRARGAGRHVCVFQNTTRLRPAIDDHAHARARVSERARASERASERAGGRAGGRASERAGVRSRARARALDRPRDEIYVMQQSSAAAEPKCAGNSRRVGHRTVARSRSTATEQCCSARTRIRGSAGPRLDSARNVNLV